MKKYIYLFSAVIFLFAIATASAQLYRVNFSSPSNNINGPNLVVNELSYTPYPVSAGSSFDVYVAVQNIGPADANNVKFTLSPDYPFLSSDNLVRTYSVIPGTVDSYRNNVPNANVVLLDFRVSVANDAPDGNSTLKLYYAVSANDPNSNILETDLPITIAKTKTDFDVVMQQSTAGQGIPFAISNTGDTTATAITVSVLPQPGIVISGPSSSIIGNLNPGDFTTTTFSLSSPGNSTITGATGARRNFSGNTGGNFSGFAGRGNNQVTIKIDYTDAAGVRDSIQKNVTLSGLSAASTARTTTATTSKTQPWYIYLIVGVVIGLVIMYFAGRKRKYKA